MKPAEQRSYLGAVQCLQALPPKNATLYERFTRFDEFVIAHVQMADSIHGVGQFLPWHRLFGHLYETALRQECQYRGSFPFWDWTRDTDGAKPIADSPLFDTSLGFGGNGSPNTYVAPTDKDNSTWPMFSATGCVLDGPFASYTLHVGPGKRYTDHCLTRGFTESQRSLFTTEAIDKLWESGDYDTFRNALDGRPFKADWRLHDGGHFTVGGDMGSFYSSPNDPLFYLHHAGIDRVWWKWQQDEPSKRLLEIGGRSSPNPPYGTANLDLLLEFGDLAPPVPLREVMDVAYEPYCYAYP